MKEITASRKDVYWKEDPRGFFTIKPFIEEGLIKVRYYQNHKLKYLIVGKTPEELYYKITSQGLVSRLEHAAYLGKELEKAYLALKYTLQYVQDDPLDITKIASSLIQQRRIVSLAPSNTEILYALGLGKNIIATTRFCDYPADAKKKQKVGGWIDVDLVQVKKLNADLVLTSTFVQDKVVQEAKKYNINIVHVDPKSIEEVYESIRILGELTYKQSEAGQLVGKIKKEFTEIQKKVILGKKPRVYIEEWHQPPHVSGNWVPELVEMAGGEYTLCKKGHVSKPITLKEVERYNPEIIILSLCGFGNKAKAEMILKRPGWENIDAVKKKRVYVIDDSLLNRPGPRLVEGLKFLVKRINEFKKIKKQELK